MVSKEYTAKKASGILKRIKLTAKTDIKRLRTVYDDFYGIPMLSNNVDRKEITISGMQSPDVICDVFNPEVIFHNAVVLYLHGGYFAAGSRLASRNLCCSLCHESGARVFCPEYRLAPEHPFPAALEDAAAVYRHICSLSGGTSSIILAGTDAGAALAAALMISLKEQHARLPSAAVFFSPWFDVACSGESFVQERKHDPVVTADGLRHCVELYTYKKNAANSKVSPMEGSVEGFPPVLIQCGEHEILRSDAERFNQKLLNSAVFAQLHVYPEMWHAFQACDALTSSALAALGEAGAFIRSTIKEKESV